MFMLAAIVTLLPILQISGQVDPHAVILAGSGSETAGEGYTLTCSVSGGGTTTPTYEWRRDGDVLPTPSPPDSLSLSPLGQADSGNYTCTVTRGTMSNESEPFLIDVSVPAITVTVDASDTDSIEGDQYTLTCSVSGHMALMPTVSYQWLREGLEILEGNTLLFERVDRNDTGNYTCIVIINSTLLFSIIEEMNSTTISVSVAPPSQPEVEVFFRTSTSVTLFWTQPLSGSFVDSYSVTYSVGVRGCSQTARRRTIDDLSNSERSFEISDLEEGSKVIAAVIAVNIGGRNYSSQVDTSTLSTRPGMVQNFKSVMATFDSITLTWDELNCADYNGPFIGYRIEYGNETFDSIEVVTETPFTAIGLPPLTSYMFRVAAVNENGTGVYSPLINKTTSLSSAEVILWQNNLRVINQSIVEADEIVQRNNDLLCLTSVDIESAGLGMWYFPDGSEVPESGSGFTVSRGPSYVALTYTSPGPSPTGLYSCIIPDSNGNNVTLFAGVYSNRQGRPVVSSVLFDFTASTLICISSGGPVSTVFWTRTFTPVSQLFPNTQQQRLIDVSTATYYSFLTINSSNIRDYGGHFTCSVSNDRGSSGGRIGINGIDITGNRLFQLGETATLTCFTSVPVEAIRWVNRTNGDIMLSEANVSDFELSFVVTPSNNNTNFTCTASDERGFVGSDTITVSVGDANSPRVPVVVETSSNETTITIIWTLTRPDSRNETFIIMYGTSPGELSQVFEAVSNISDELYSAELESLEPGTTYHFQIRSTNAFDSVTSEERSISTIDVDPLEVFVTGNGSQVTGESYTLTCTATGGGVTITPVYQWIRFSVLPLQSPPDQYFFPALRRVDSGEYFCRVTKGSMAVKSSRFNITVVDPLAVILTGSGSETAGESYTLTCSVSGRGTTTPTYEWRRDGDVLPTPSSPDSLSLSPLGQADSGNYTCTVTRGSLTDSSNVLVVTVAAPEVRLFVSRDSVSAIEGSQYILTCNVNGHQSLLATVTYLWLREDVVVAQGQDGNTLELDPANRNDNGTYTCQATVSSPLLNQNITAEGDTSFFVIVLVPAQPVVTIISQGTNSITFSWTQPPSGSFVDSYIVQYNSSLRSCPDLPALETSPIMINSTVREFEITNLEEDSVLSGTVTALNIVGSSSTTFTTRTLTTSPGEVKMLRSIGASFDSISLRWDELNCLDHNGPLTGYRVEYGILSFENSEMVIEPSFTATGLLPLMTYMFRVAAVNSNGTGVFSAPINQTTLSAEVILQLDNLRVVNESIIDSDEIVVEGNDLLCLTNFDTGSVGVGSWFFPDGSEVPFSGSGFIQRRGPSYVALSYSPSGSSPTSGLYRCVIPDLSGQNVSLFAGIYSTNEGSAMITLPVLYDFLSSTVTCVSSGGPATEVTWTRDGAPISQFTQQQQLTDVESATYHNALIITSSNISEYRGLFTCRVSNERGNDSQSLEVNGIAITGNRVFELGEVARIRCLAPIPVESIVWVNDSDAAELVSRASVAELELNFEILVSRNNTSYTCTVQSPGFTESVTATIGIEVDGLPRAPDVVIAESTHTTITIRWSFTTLLDVRNETFTVTYGTTPGNLIMTSPPVLSMPGVQDYSILLESLQPGLTYFYQIHSRNRFSVFVDEERNIQTKHARSAAVRNVNSESLDDMTLLLTWQTPEPTNGDIENYLVRVLLDMDSILEMNVTKTNVTVRNLSPGIPYVVSITPVNLAGKGDIHERVYFTRELTPISEVMNVQVNRTSPTTMDVSWRPLSLSEARGFVTFYSIAYTSMADSRRRQALQDTMYINASANSSRVTVEGLNGDLEYSVTVSAGTRAGLGPQSEPITVQDPDTTETGYTGPVVGVVVSILVIIALSIVVIVLAVLARRKKNLLKIEEQVDREYNANPAEEDVTISVKESKMCSNGSREETEDNESSVGRQLSTTSYVAHLISALAGPRDFKLAASESSRPHLRNDHKLDIHFIRSNFVQLFEHTH